MANEPEVVSTTKYSRYVISGQAICLSHVYVTGITVQSLVLNPCVVYQFVCADTLPSVQSMYAMVCVPRCE